MDRTWRDMWMRAGMNERKDENIGENIIICTHLLDVCRYYLYCTYRGANAMNEYKLPLLPPSVELETKLVLKALAEQIALAELKGYARYNPNKHILINAVIMRLRIFGYREYNNPHDSV